MIKKRTICSLAMTLCCIGAFAWEGQWISARSCNDASNTWMLFNKTFEIGELPAGEAIASIAVDSKYWLWVNGERVVYEGGLKRGPTPRDTYVDKVELAPYLKTGENSINVLVWYFGKQGFCHNSSGKAGLFFECPVGDRMLVSDHTWMSKVVTAYENTANPNPNFRLPESNVRFNALLDDFDRINAGLPVERMEPSMTRGIPPVAPWNKLIERPTPQWKDYGLKEYVNQAGIPGLSTGDTIVCRLPYNCHVSPYLEIESPAGLTLEMRTDAYDAFNQGQHPSVRAEYVTREGTQKYESYGWMNGNVVRYYIPEGVKILSLKYRETGFNCEFSGHFDCNDPYFERLWKKAARTLYVTMRDTYMDCPDRERSQWWGDMVNESGEAFYAMSPEAISLTRKGMMELIKWQRRDSTIFAPIPAGNWSRELPGQMLASVGYYGFWNYFMNTGDTATLERVYWGVKTYLHKWKLNPDGTVKFRSGEWPWGDWGTDKDTEFLYNAWYSLALKGFRNMAQLFNIQLDVEWAQERMDQIEAAVNKQYWRGDHYRSSDYQDDIDDRSQALAVLAGYADRGKYPALFEVLKEKEYASPYMEKYVIEALFVMGYPEYGLERLKKRFAGMVDHPYYTTLWEGWEIGSSTYGGGTFNHAWSGGGLTILSQYVAGIYPLEPGFESFEVRPHMAGLTEVRTGNETIAGRIEVSLQQKEKTLELVVEVPQGTQCMVCIPAEYGRIRGNGELIFDGQSKGNRYPYQGEDAGYHTFLADAGEHEFLAR
jgi:alpha-L-rhamnosidase